MHVSASIIRGPNNKAASHPPIDYTRFLRLAKTHAPKATLVLGWTDAPASDGEETRYSWDTVMEMQEVVDKWKLKQPVSYSVRASLTKQSLPQLRWLMEMTDRSSLTVVAPKGDEIPVMDLIYIRNKLPKNRVLYDLHSELRSQFDPLKDYSLNAMNQFKGGANVHSMDQRAAAVIPDDNTFRGMDWNVAEGDNSQKVYLGTQTVIMQKGLLVSKKQYESSVSTSIIINGRIEFFRVNKGASGTNVRFEVFLEAFKRIKQSHDAGLKCSITLDGAVSIVDETEKSIQLPGESPCFVFSIIYEPNSNVDIRVTRPKSCGHMPESLSQGSDGLVHLNMPLKGKKQTNQYIAMRHNDENSFVAVDQFRIKT